MNCLLLFCLLLCCGGNGSAFSGGNCGCGNSIGTARNNGRGCGNGIGTARGDVRGCDSGVVYAGNDDCGCGDITGCENSSEFVESCDGGAVPFQNNNVNPYVSNEPDYGNDPRNFVPFQGGTFSCEGPVLNQMPISSMNIQENQSIQDFNQPM